MKIEEYYGIVSFIEEDETSICRAMKENQSMIESLEKCKLFFVKNFREIAKKNKNYKVSVYGKTVVYIGIFEKPVIIFTS